jgi:predicted permease
VVLRTRLEREMQEEMRQHLERAVERLRARGWAADEAMRAARREFGNVAYLQEQARAARGGRGLESWLADVRFGLRHFARTPLTSATMMVVLALGMGINTALFAVLHSVATLPPRGIARDDALVRIRGLEQTQDGRRKFSRVFSYPEVMDYAARRELFSDVMAWSSASVVLDFGDGDQGVTTGSAVYVTDNYFRVLGVRPILGAGLPAGTMEDLNSPPLVALISHALWDQRFGRSRAVLGKTVSVNGVTVTITGVAPAGFKGADSHGGRLHLWLPLAARSPIERGSPYAFASADSSFLRAVALLRPGVLVQQATPTVRAVAARYPTVGTWRPGTVPSADVAPLLSNNEGPANDRDIRIATLAASAVGLLVLLVVCTNASALLVGLGMARRREIAVRLSLGAARMRIIRQLITESVLLASAAGVLGLLVIGVLIAVLGNRIPDAQILLSWRALGFTFGCALATGILFGVSPALHATRLAVADVLKDSATAVAASRSLLQRGLVVAQIALTQPLLVGLAALVLAVLSDLRGPVTHTIDDRIVLLDFDVLSGNRSQQQRVDDMRRLRARLAAVPGVVGALAYSEGASSFDVFVHPDDRVVGSAHAQSFRVYTRDAPPGYFALMDIPLVRGREFVAADQQAASASAHMIEDGRGLVMVRPGNASSVIVIGSDLASKLWGTADPIGRRFISGRSGQPGDAELVVVGVVDDGVAGASDYGNGARVYSPRSFFVHALLIRTRGPAEPMMPLLRSVARAAAPHIPLSGATTIAAREARERQATLQASGASAGAGLLALFLAAIGLYAVVAFAVAQRTREIGIRTALGAQRRQVVGMFFWRGLRLSILGLVIGLPLSLIVLRLVEGPGSSPIMLALFIVPPVLVVATLATWLPAWRAAGIDPLLALRTE